MRKPNTWWPDVRSRWHRDERKQQPKGITVSDLMDMWNCFGFARRDRHSYPEALGVLHVTQVQQMLQENGRASSPGQGKSRGRSGKIKSSAKTLIRSSLLGWLRSNNILELRFAKGGSRHFRSSVLPQASVPVVRMICVAIGHTARSVRPATATEHSPLLRCIASTAHQQVHRLAADVAGLPLISCLLLWRHGTSCSPLRLQGLTPRTPGFSLAHDRHLTIILLPAFVL
mmetsp:Transcript_22604/g.30572  ORF Transcript_22604/g.30572 Transcript_22604/m.30572 type:complete len:229 (-) Transcript_22604:55-741(-)